MCTTCEVISPTAICNLSTALNIIQGLSTTNSCFKLTFRFPDQHFVFLKYLLYVTGPTTSFFLRKITGDSIYELIHIYVIYSTFLFISSLLSPNILPKILVLKQYQLQLSTISVCTIVPLVWPF